MPSACGGLAIIGEDLQPLLPVMDTPAGDSPREDLRRHRHDPGCPYPAQRCPEKNRRASVRPAAVELYERAGMF